MEVDNLLFARWQMALTLGAHIIVACFGVGMPVLMLTAEYLAYRRRDPLWLELARRWAKAFAVLFAVGAVSGTVLSFELGLLWPEFMGRFGAVIGLPFTIEGFAFFLEAIFLGIYLYGWKRLSPWVHWWSGTVIALSGMASAFFVVTANAWMNVPRGFEIVDGKVTSPDPLAAMFNPAAAPQAVHMILSAYIVTGFMVAAFYASVHLWGRATRYHGRAMMLGLAMGCVAIPLQFVAGDWAARTVAQTQPVKLAALEGQYKTERGAPLRIGGWPNDTTRETSYAIELPGLLSLLAYHDPDAVVQGLDDFPRDETPPTLVVHLAFQAMIGAGFYLMGVALVTGLWLWRRRALPEGAWYLWFVLLSGPLAIVALETGWIVTEVGRQPWIVHKVMRTSEAVTGAEGIGYLLATTIVIYTILLVGSVSVLRLLARVPLENVPMESPKHGA